VAYGGECSLFATRHHALHIEQYNHSLAVIYFADSGDELLIAAVKMGKGSTATLRYNWCRKLRSLTGETGMVGGTDAA